MKIFALVFGRLVVAIVSLAIAVFGILPWLARAPAVDIGVPSFPLALEVLSVFALVGLLAIALFSSISALRLNWRHWAGRN